MEEDKAIVQFLTENNFKNIVETVSKLSKSYITLEDLMMYREKEIKNKLKKQRELCECLNIDILSKIDLCKILRNTQGSRCYYDAKNERPIVSTVILSNDAEEQLQKIYIKYKKCPEKKESFEKKKN
ncbi:hypothetical protein RFI_25173 [Reticulomyxa filosa]|uniref:Uncharacterized protein n=1 Tax=Reticulomyxa filosa TaxID=46433 RepID=X6MGM8_RETFI|nr:hypothetical protein RFI_25173 [Reticulomyxa filosa]|eukprot:ETO12205.1 hypothetical protein RFI_25173 [Reticulomyxa filosa]